MFGEIGAFEEGYVVAVELGEPVEVELGDAVVVGWAWKGELGEIVVEFSSRGRGKFAAWLLLFADGCKDTDLSFRIDFTIKFPTPNCLSTFPFRVNSRPITLSVWTILLENI